MSEIRHGPLKPTGPILGMDEDIDAEIRRIAQRFERDCAWGAGAMLALIFIFVGVSYVG